MEPRRRHLNHLIFDLSPTPFLIFEFICALARDNPFMRLRHNIITPTLILSYVRVVVDFLLATDYCQHKPDATETTATRQPKAGRPCDLSRAHRRELPATCTQRPSSPSLSCSGPLAERSGLESSLPTRDIYQGCLGFLTPNPRSRFDSIHSSSTSCLSAAPLPLPLPLPLTPPRPISCGTDVIPSRKGRAFVAVVAARRPPVTPARADRGIFELTQRTEP